MTKLAWKPWHEVVKLREDLRSGKLPMHLFAADLYEVMMQGGKLPVYEQPEQFFALTFPTHNLRNLVRDVALRLAGKNDKAVRQLELTYGGGKTHTLITLRHLVDDPDELPALPAVNEFREAVGETMPRARVAALCFDKLDVEIGVDVRGPDGTVRRLKQPWSVLAYQIGGDDGLRLMHADGEAEERETPPAENTLTDLLSIPGKDGLGTLILIDEALLYAKVKVRSDKGWLDILTSFFQYLTQAAAKVDRCCIVASLLSTQPEDQADELGKQIVEALYNIFQRQREAAIQPVEKDDVAEVLRRRLFDPESLMDRSAWNQHVIAALKGVTSIDERTANDGANAESRYGRSYPFNPELTDVFYTKWASGIERFQKTRGVLRTFALALREAEKWDTSPLIGPAVFLAAPGVEGLSESGAELVTVADTIVSDGSLTKWTGILEGELRIARSVQVDSVGLHHREIEQSVMSTFLHSQPVGRSAKLRDLMLLVGPSRTDKIELEKGFNRWARTSHWLDDANVPEVDGKLPDEWRLGNRPNLNQMQSAAAIQLSDEVVRARLIDEIGKTKQLTAGASAYGVRVHVLPKSPRDIEDDGLFHYAVLPPAAASESGKPSAEARRHLDETTGPEKPRVNRNALILLTPSKDGLEVATARVRDYLGWEKVQADLTAPTDDGRSVVDYARTQTLKISVDKARGRVPEAIRQAYCVVVTASDKNNGEPTAFKVTVSAEPHFESIKLDPRSRVQDTPVTAEALLPDGPYSLWKDGETSQRVRTLSGAFAQFPHLPKMLKTAAIVETLVEGCENGSFVLRLPRPDQTFRTWWRGRPDDVSLVDRALELVLVSAAELTEIPLSALKKGMLQDLWTGDEVTVESVGEYFSGDRVVSVNRGSYVEPVAIPKAGPDVVRRAISDAVQAGDLWLVAGPASLLAEPIPAGVLSPTSVLRMPPESISAAAIMPEVLPDAWEAGLTTAMAIAGALSAAAGITLPWKTVKDVIAGALSARFVALAEDSSAWPCDFAGAGKVRLMVPEPTGADDRTAVYNPAESRSPNVRIAESELGLSQLQDLAEVVPGLSAAKAKYGVPLKVVVKIEVGDDGHAPSNDALDEINRILDEVSEKLKLSNP